MPTIDPLGTGPRDDRPLNALTVDVEEYFHAEALASVAAREHWESLPSRVVASTERLLDLFDRAGVTGTFFVLGWTAERHGPLVRRIADAGHEIACHGYSHRLVYRQPREQFRQETRRARSLLQDLTGQTVAGYRAASFSIVRESLWALEELAAAGFDYDSSIFPIRHDVYGMPEAPTRPFRVDTEAGSLIEFPLSTARIGGLRLPASGGGYFRLLPLPIGLKLLDAVNATGDPFIFYMHPWEIDAAQPRFALGMRSRLRHYTNLSRFERKLERLLGRYRLGRMDAMAANHGVGPAVETVPVEHLAA